MNISSGLAIERFHERSYCTEFRWNVRRNIHIPGGQVNQVSEGVQGAESASSVLDNLDNAVEALGNCIRQARVDECQYSIVVALQGPHELFHGRQAASVYGRHPAL